jgi:transposase InsO family protein
MVYLFTVMDLFTKFAFAFPVRNHEATTLAQILVDRIFAEYGCPLQLVSDLGPELQGSIMTELCRAMGIDKMRTTAYRPQGNAQLERWHRTLNGLLGKVVSESQKDWPAHVPAALAAYRATEHDSTGFTPNMMLFGREVNLPLDLAYGVDLEESERSDSSDRYVSELQDRLRQTYSTARVALAKAVTRNKKAYDLRSKPQQYEVGMWVWYYYPRRFTGKSPKFQRMFTGPFLIVKMLGAVNMVLQKGPRANPFVVHVDKLKRCYGPTPRDWRKEETSSEVSILDGLPEGWDNLAHDEAADGSDGSPAHQGFGGVTRVEGAADGSDGTPALQSSIEAAHSEEVTDDSEGQPARQGAGAMIQEEGNGACGDRLLELQGFSDSLGGGDERHLEREEHVGGGVLGQEGGAEGAGLPSPGEGRPRRVVQKPARYRD